MGVAPQELALYLWLSARENLLFFGRLAGLSGRSLERCVEEVADSHALRHVMDRRTQDLSGGEKRRLHTAIAMLARPPLLLLDEPTAGVDVHTRQRLLRAITRLADEGTAICYTTHYLHEVEALDASAAILEDGSVIAYGRVDDLIAASGETTVEVRLSGMAPPGLSEIAHGDGEESVLRITDRDASVAMTRALTSVGGFADRVRSVDVVQPSLESVYLSLTGRRFEKNGAGNKS
jgi:ABC-2 type transport system ATP-binding protein